MDPSSTDRKPSPPSVSTGSEPPVSDPGTQLLRNGSTHPLSSQEEIAAVGPRDKQAVSLSGNRWPLRKLASRLSSPQLLHRRKQVLFSRVRTELAATDSLMKLYEHALGSSLLRERPALPSAHFNNEPPLAALEASSTALRYAVERVPLKKASRFGSLRVISSLSFGLAMIGVISPFSIGWPMNRVIDHVRIEWTIRKLSKQLAKAKQNFEAALPTLYGIVIHDANKMTRESTGTSKASHHDAVPTIIPDRIREILEEEFKKASDKLQDQRAVSLRRLPSEGAPEISDNDAVPTITLEQVREILAGEIEKVSDILRGQVDQVATTLAALLDQRLEKTPDRDSNLLHDECFVSVSREEIQRIINAIAQPDGKLENGIDLTQALPSSGLSFPGTQQQQQQGQLYNASKCLEKIANKGITALANAMAASPSQMTSTPTGIPQQPAVIIAALNVVLTLVADITAGFGAHYAKGSRNAVQDSATAALRSAGATERNATTAEGQLQLERDKLQLEQVKYQLEMDRFKFEQQKSAGQSGDDAPNPNHSNGPDATGRDGSTRPAAPPGNGLENPSQSGPSISVHSPSPRSSAAGRKMSAQQRVKMSRELRNVERVRKEFLSRPKAPARKAVPGRNVLAFHHQQTLEKQLSASLQRHRLLDRNESQSSKAKGKQKESVSHLVHDFGPCTHPSTMAEDSLNQQSDTEDLPADSQLNWGFANRSNDIAMTKLSPSRNRNSSGENMDGRTNSLSSMDTRQPAASSYLDAGPVPDQRHPVMLKSPSLATAINGDLSPSSLFPFNQTAGTISTPALSFSFGSKLSSAQDDDGSEPVAPCSPNPDLAKVGSGSPQPDMGCSEAAIEVITDDDVGRH